MIDLSSNWKNSKGFLFFGICCLIVGVSVAVKKTNEGSKLAELYPRLLKEHRLNSSVSKISKDRSYIHVDFADGNRYTIYFARNKKYNPSDLTEFLSVGDFLFKRNGSDTIEVRRGNDLFVFVNGKDL